MGVDRTYRIRVETSAAAAVEVVKEELERLHFLNYCQIGITDDGVNWHAVHPHSDTPLVWLMSMERQELWAEQYQKKMARLAQFLRGEATSNEPVG